MYREIGLSDTKLGMILLYTAVNVSLAVWLLKGFIDEIPREYEEAAMIDGARPSQTYFLVILPQLRPVLAVLFVLMRGIRRYFASNPPLARTRT